MVTISEPAKAKLDEYFSQNEKSPIRIFLASSCAGTRLALALDDPKDTDDVFAVEGYSFVVDKELGGKAAPLGVDIDCSGFTITSNLQLESGGGCGGCSCSSSGGCS